MESLNGIQLISGMKVWVDMPHMPGFFPGDVMLAQVIEGHRKAQKGEVWVQQLPTPGCPIEGDAWISEQHCHRCLAF